MKQLFKLKNYTFFSLLKLVMDSIYTRLWFAGSRIIRRPFYVKGLRHIDFGKNLTTGVGCRIEAFPEENKTCLTFGQNVEINDYVHIGAIESVKIGNNVLIASKVFISDHNHGCYTGDSPDHPHTPPKERKLYSRPVVIEDNVWLGEFVAVLPGVTIGSGSIVGTMSVVTRDVPPYCIAAGVPAKVIKKFDFARNEWIKV